MRSSCFRTPLIDRTLGAMRMLGSAIHVQAPDELVAETVVRKHAPHRATHDLFRTTLQQTLQRLDTKPSGIPRVPRVRLLAELVAGDADLRRVHDDDRVAHVQM